MKKLRITLNQKVYEVMVEVLEDDEPSYPGATTLPPSPRPMPVAQAAATSPAPRPAPKATEGKGQVLAPIVGTVTKVLVKVGEAVKENQPLVVLDAMKMDTYVNSSRDGVVASVDCAVGDSVSLGQQLLTLE
ncbi:MAG TPA: hypothetical protein PKM35_14655 [Holophaga sp.]|nr:hypothetical protein [Holophaga sp.]